jgi:hypothetical protein
VEQSNSLKPSSKRRKNEKSVRNILRLRTSPLLLNLTQTV